MDLQIITTQNTAAGKKTLPAQFQEEVREDLIKRAVEAVVANKRQQYGADPRAGKKSAAKLSRRRRDYKASYGHGISRVPRKTLSRNGAHFNWAGAYAPGTVGGRRAFPPKPVKDWSQKINDKERKKALRSALSATMKKEMAEARGHIVPKQYPFLLSKDFETMDKTQKLLDVLTAQGFEQELERAAVRKVRAGKGKMRGRKYQTRKSMLIVTSEPCKLTKAAQNIPGVDAIDIKKINAELLAPGKKAGRLTLFTEKAIEQLENDKLFI